MIYGAVSPNDGRYSGEPCNELNYKRELDLHERDGLQAHGFHRGSPAKAFTAAGCNFVARPNRLENVGLHPRWLHTGGMGRKGVGAAARPFLSVMSDVFFVEKSYFR
jgi:hypothetical protein